MVELRLISMVDLGVKNVLKKFLTKADNDYFSSDEEIKSKINNLKKTITVEKEFIRKKSQAVYKEILENDSEKVEKNNKSNYKFSHNSFNDYNKDIISKKKKSYNQLFNENYKEFIKDSLIYQYNPLNDLQTLEKPDKKLKQTPIRKNVSFNIQNQVFEKQNNEILSKGSTFSYINEPVKPYKEKIFQKTNSIPTIQMSENDEPEDIRNIIHINKNNYEDIDYIVTQMRKTILYSNKNPIGEIINFKEFTSSSESSCDISNTIIKIKETNNEIKNKNQSSQNINVVKNEIMNEKELQEQKEKQFRNLLKKLDLVYDTDSEEEDMDLKVHSIFSKLYILPYSKTKIFFDAVLLFFVVYTMFQIPYILAFPEYNENKNKMKNNFIVNIIIDLYFFFDIIVCCITAYTDIIEEKLITSFKLIFQRYLKEYFIFDILSAMPINSILDFNDIYFIGKYKVYTHYFRFIYLLKLLRLIKCFKVLLHNSFLNYFIKLLNKITGSLYMEKYYRTFLSIYCTFYSFHFFGCVFIFVGKSNYPNWIIKQELDVKDDFEIYIAALYFVCATVFSVGYGDIVSYNYYERFFNVIMLILGMLLYTWMISAISNYFMDNDVDLIKYKKNLNLLNEIRIKHDNFSDDLYQKIRRFLLYKRENDYKNYNNIYDNLPVIMRNNLIFEMYKPIIENFVFFKNFDDQDFILKIILCLKPFNAIKGERLVNDGDFIDEIIFVKNGCLSVEFPLPLILLNQSKKSMKMGKKNKSNYSIEGKKEIKEKYTFLNTLNFGKVKTFIRNIIEKKKKKKMNKPHIKLIEIRKNEHFGDIIMFLNKRSPLSLKVKSRKAELLFLMKTDAIEISVGFPKIWKKILKNSLYNMQQIDILINKYLQIFFFNYKKPFKDTTSLIKEKTEERRKSKTEEIDQFLQIKRKSQILFEPSCKSFNETSRTKSNDKSSNSFEISFKESKSINNNKNENSLIEFESDDSNKNDSLEEIEIEFNKNKKENKNEKKKSMFNNSFYNNINEEFKNNEIILKNNFLFKRIKNKFTNLQIIHNEKFTMPIIDNNELINEKNLIILGKNKLGSPPLRYRLISPKVKNYKNKLSIVNEHQNKSNSNQNHLTINKNEFIPLSPEEIEKNTIKIHKNATMNIKNQKDFYLEFNKSKLPEKKSSIKNFFEEKNKTNIITKRKSILKNKNSLSQISSDKEKSISSIGTRKKNFFHSKSKGMENNSNNNIQRSRRKSQWSIINDNIKENEQNLKNPEEFYSAIFSKMINNKDNDDDDN